MEQKRENISIVIKLCFAVITLLSFAQVPQGRVPVSGYWQITDAENQAVGVVRLAFEQDEMQMYKKMYNELDQQGDKGVYESLREELGGGSAGGAPYSSIEEAIDREEAILNDADGIGSLADADDDVLIASPNIGEPDMDKFMEAAVAEVSAAAAELPLDAQTVQTEAVVRKLLLFCRKMRGYLEKCLDSMISWF